MLRSDLRYLGLALGSLVVAACAGPRNAEVPEPPPAAAGDEADRPELSVDYHAGTGMLVIDGDRPMYVAVFHVRGGKDRPALIFPTRSDRIGKVAPGERLVLSGRQTEGLPRQQLTSPGFFDEPRDFRVTPLGAREDYRRGSRPVAGEPRYIYVLASTAPLSTDPLVERMTMPDHPAFRQTHLQPKLDVITSRVLTVTADSTWTEAIQVLYP